MGVPSEKLKARNNRLHEFNPCWGTVAAASASPTPRSPRCRCSDHRGAAEVAKEDQGRAGDMIPLTPTFASSR
jgi:hypothetical protein